MAERIIPDPGLTVYEGLVAMGALYAHMQKEDDALAASGWDKLRQSINYTVEHFPEDFEAVEASIAMHKRFRGEG